MRTVLLGLLVLAACSEVTAPSIAMEYELVSINGGALPVVLLSDYDSTVEVISDVVTLRADSTFVEIARLRGALLGSTLVVTDSVSGTWSVAGTELQLLLANARVSRFQMAGTAITQTVGGRTFVYQRR